MADREKKKSKLTLVIVSVVLLVVVVGGFLLYNAGLLGGNSCKALLRKYNAAGAVEDYSVMGEVFPLMMEKGCEFD